MMMNNKPPSISLRVWQGTPALFSQTSQSPHVPPHPAQLFCWLGSLAGLQGFGLDMDISNLLTSKTKIVTKVMPGSWRVRHPPCRYQGWR